MDFEYNHLSIIEQYESSAAEIERVFFTGRYKLSKKHYSLLAVQSISILYSYWEGFVQKSFQLYIDYLNSLSLDFNMFSNEITVFHMDNSFKQFSQYPKKPSMKIAFYDQLKQHFGQDKHNLYPVVDTKSNVAFDVLNALLMQFSLSPFPEYWDKYQYPKPNLKEALNSFVRYRNGVAHGGDISSEEKISQELYSYYRHLISDLMYEMHNKFMDGINEQKYLRCQTSV